MSKTKNFGNKKEIYVSSNDYRSLFVSLMRFSKSSKKKKNCNFGPYLL